MTVDKYFELAELTAADMELLLHEFNLIVKSDSGIISLPA
jgi:hypothetical protein